MRTVGTTNLGQLAGELGWEQTPGRYFPATQDTSTAPLVDQHADMVALRLDACARACGIGTLVAMIVLVVAFVAAARLEAGPPWGWITLASFVATAVLAITGALLRQRFNRIRERTGRPVAAGMLNIVKQAHIAYLGIGELMAAESEQTAGWRLGWHKRQRDTNQHRRQTWQKVLHHLESAERARRRSDKTAWVECNSKALAIMGPFFGSGDTTDE